MALKARFGNSRVTSHIRHWLRRNSKFISHQSASLGFLIVDKATNKNIGNKIRDSRIPTHICDRIPINHICDNGANKPLKTHELLFQIYEFYVKKRWYKVV